ncbi:MULTISPECIES: MFS transporter [Marinomonas]|uniref:MFS transporter n=1 Tax=Marinomonas rhodophyticola TaxID=2992803 RepID=A0ABT3KCC4_9GAMM|nr:MFS transporter [Marinomonas sp. KJ51-3]MCW4628177.1 MFS transporter [Marinomonas sp. KJ51-3]
MSSAEKAQGYPTPQRYYAAAAILIGVVMAALDSSIVNIALPNIADSLEINAATVIWVANGYQTASAATMLICASLGSRIGERRFYKIGIIFFTLSSIGCALSPTFSILLTMRIIQGISYAVMISVGLSLYRVIFPPKSLGSIFGLNALAFAIGTATGPVFGGLIMSYLSWPWLFYINIPLGGIAIYFAIMALGKDTSTKSGFDFIGAMTSALAFGLLTISVDQIGRWNDILVCFLISLSAALIVFFVSWQKRAKYPLMPLDIFHSKRYSFAVLSSILMFIAQGIGLISIPFVLQYTYSYSVLESALIFTPWPVAVAICAPLSGKLSNKINATQISTMGIIIFCVGLGSLALIPNNTSYLDFIWRVAICGIGYGLFLPPNNKEMFSNVEEKYTVTASGILSTARTAGQSLGAALVAVIIVVLSKFSGNFGDYFSDYAFGLACLIAGGASIASLFRISK